MKMSEFPEDLLEEILCRVPARSLKRLQSTCQRWNQLFSDRRFTTKHFHKAAKQPLILMLKKIGFYSMIINLQQISSVEVTGELNLNLIDHHSSIGELGILRFCHSDCLLLCVCFYKEFNCRLVVLNPCTNQTKSIEPLIRYKTGNVFGIGSYQDHKTGNTAYKILTYFSCDGKKKCEIYDSISTSWRIFDGMVDFELLYLNQVVSLKGKTYWFARDGKEKHLSMFLISFDYTTEIFERLHLPYQYPRYVNVSLSAVRQEKLSVLLQYEMTSKTEVWVMKNKPSESKEVSWSLVLALDLTPELDLWHNISFLVNEEKKILVCCEYKRDKRQNIIYIVGEDNKVRQEAIGVAIAKPYLFTYVPSLIQI